MSRQHVTYTSYRTPLGYPSKTWWFKELKAQKMIRKNYKYSTNYAVFGFFSLDIYYFFSAFMASSETVKGMEL